MAAEELSRTGIYKRYRTEVDELQRKIELLESDNRDFHECLEGTIRENQELRGQIKALRRLLGPAAPHMPLPEPAYLSKTHLLRDMDLRLPLPRVGPAAAAQQQVQQQRSWWAWWQHYYAHQQQQQQLAVAAAAARGSTATPQPQPPSSSEAEQEQGGARKRARTVGVSTPSRLGAAAGMASSLVMLTTMIGTLTPAGFFTSSRPGAKQQQQQLSAPVDPEGLHGGGRRLAATPVAVPLLPVNGSGAWATGTQVAKAESRSLVSNVLQSLVDVVRGKGAGNQAYLSPRYQRAELGDDLPDLPCRGARAVPCCCPMLPRGSLTLHLFVGSLQRSRPPLPASCQARQQGRTWYQHRSTRPPTGSSCRSATSSPARRMTAAAPVPPAAASCSCCRGSGTLPLRHSGLGPAAAALARPGPAGVGMGLPPRSRP